MEQETTQSSVAVEERPFKPLDPLTIVQKHLNKISEAIKENTVAMVEMGIITQKLENKIDQLLKKGVHLG